MDTEFNPLKDAANMQKHGVSLTLANEIEWSDVLCFVDDRADYGEVREVGFTVIEMRLFVVVFVQRGNTMRIISLRKANKREIKLYDQAIENQ
ncbi:BrnT family toxin [Diaphorobacter sp. HDW4A]|uniref:BrnT family toxin n=1 Tax=Diaphorobacter sp. HDW4A TaxID=2714924 RepID=UPI00140B7C41|nr:BrnT family toxin [Diaphorobacter sp. HDW4A]QIL80804.1 BrnT family toxin [Diaphorobacter sp. HDW4A]